MQGSLDISFDRKLGVVWGERTLDTVHKKSYWLIDLQTGEVEDLLIKFEEKAADIVRGSEDVRFSPDGKHLLISAHYCKSARIFDLSTRKCVVVGGGEYRTILWVGNRLLFESLHSSEIRDVAGKVLEKKLLDNVIASDPTGKKLLVGWPRPMVISPEATILREFGDSACDKETPLLSRSGNWAGVFCKGEDGWAYSVVSTTTDKVYRLRRPWGATLALTDNGDSIFAVGDDNSTFGAVMTGGRAVEATTADIVFWPKEDDPWKSTKGAPPGPKPNDILWNAMPKGKSQIIARKAMALTLLGKELFFVEADGNERVLKAVGLPGTEVSSSGNESRGSQKQ